MPDLTDTIAEMATQPVEAQNETGRMRMRTVDEMIAADQYAKQGMAATKPHRGIRMTKLIPPGGV
jgi:hypothetical protein